MEASSFEESHDVSVTPFSLTQIRRKAVLINSKYYREIIKRHFDIAKQMRASPL